VVPLASLLWLVCDANADSAPGISVPFGALISFDTIPRVNELYNHVVQ
jgi:hypothetical protein